MIRKWNLVMNTAYTLNKRSVTFGLLEENSVLVNTYILCIKCFTQKCKLEGTVLNLSQFKLYMKAYFPPWNDDSVAVENVFNALQ